MATGMTVTELQSAIDAHGADLNRWPVDLRNEAAGLVANVPEARTLLQAALTLDAAMRKPAAVEAPAGLVDRILEQALRQRPGKGSR